jgi:hypothetical protein
MSAADHRICVVVVWRYSGIIGVMVEYKIRIVIIVGWYDRISYVTRPVRARMVYRTHRRMVSVKKVEKRKAITDSNFSLITRFFLS